MDMGNGYVGLWVGFGLVENALFLNCFDRNSLVDEQVDYFKTNLI